MKPREFDDLVKRKFDEGAFEYKAQNWDRLAEELDGRGKKRALLVWWMPLIGVAASVALAMGVPSVLNQGSTINQHPQAQYANVVTADAVNDAPQVAAVVSAVPATPASEAIKHVAAQKTTPEAKAGLVVNSVASKTIQLQDATDNESLNATLINKSKLPGFNTAIETFATAKNDVKKIKKVLPNIGYYTFKEIPASKSNPKVAISVSGGVNYGVQSNGYMLGATARRMINDKVYVEGDLAFLGTNNSGKYSEVEYSERMVTTDNNPATSAKTAPMGNSGTIGGNSVSAMGPVATVAARGVTTGKSTGEDVVAPTTTTIQSRIKTVEKQYNLYYAQLTPTIGYKIMKRMSIGVGPDFQQMLGDNRPAVSSAETGNIQEVPMFDIGFMGKSEFAVSKNVKAAVYYREGINNIITPMNRYIDRNYVQFQIKCAILNR